jgi:CRP/FNR family transcriptional regulator, cyclic AMP receptor protein
MRTVKNELRELNLFSELSRSELTFVGQQLTMLPLPAGTVLVREGERGEEFMVIFEGEAEVTKGGRTIATLGRGDLVGEMALLQGRWQGRRNATVTAITDVVVYVGTRSEFHQMIHAAPSVADKVHQSVASRSEPLAA